MPSFYDYFRENMESLGLPAPQSLFGPVSTATATSTTILTQVEKSGRKVTVREVIGSIAVALGRTGMLVLMGIDNHRLRRKIKR